MLQQCAEYDLGDGECNTHERESAVEREGVTGEAHGGNSEAEDA